MELSPGGGAVLSGAATSRPEADRSRRRAMSAPQKSCGQLLGESWPRAIRPGTGRGGDVTGSRVLWSS